MCNEYLIDCLTTAVDVSKLALHGSGSVWKLWNSLVRTIELPAGMDISETGVEVLEHQVGAHPAPLMSVQAEVRLLRTAIDVIDCDLLPHNSPLQLLMPKKTNLVI